MPKKTTKSPTRRIYKLSQKQIPACENGSVAKGEGNISTRSTRTKRFRSARKNDLDLRRSTNIDTVGYDPYERYLDLTSQHRDRFMRIMENMREKTSYQYQRAAEKTRHYEEKDQKLHDFIPKPGLTPINPALMSTTVPRSSPMSVTHTIHPETNTYFLEIVGDRPDFTFKATAALDATIHLFEDLEFKKMSERIQKKIKPKTCFFQICFLTDF